MASVQVPLDSWWLLGGALAALFVIAIISPLLVRAWRRYRPIRLKLVVPLPIISASAFSETTDVGNFGELLVSLWLAKDGWKQLPSKTGAGGQGLDGLFLRERRRGWGVDALAIEVKTNSAQFKPEQMADEKVKKALQELYALGQLDQETAKALIKALDGRSRRFRKQYWNPNLSTGRVEYCDLDARGNRGACTDLPKAARFVEALVLGLRQFDRGKRYMQ